MVELSRFKVRQLHLVGGRKVRVAGKHLTQLIETIRSPLRVVMPSSSHNGQNVRA
jgi:hypothetical protein